MDKYYYLMGTDPKPVQTCVNSQPDGYIPFGDGGVVDWTLVDYVDGDLVEISQPEPPSPIVPTLAETKQFVLRQISQWTRTAIVGGFSSSASGAAHTYDSTDEDQCNIKLMQTVSHSERFATSVYQGRIPIRAIPAGATEKTVLYLTTAQMDILIEDMALHIGTCKQHGGALQGQVAAATTKEEVNAITWD